MTPVRSALILAIAIGTCAPGCVTSPAPGPDAGPPLCNEPFLHVTCNVEVTCAPGTDEDVHPHVLYYCLDSFTPADQQQIAIDEVWGNGPCDAEPLRVIAACGVMP